ncbi:MAG: type II 3-dehydroquinate dehydratase [Halanaerobiales bacterium]|nr:type II 3-dehydroquinate dehydratase [Halanaerobiales bacterium]
MKKIAVINGPNLNMLNIREKDIYGSESLDQINNDLKEIADNNNIDISFFQSNHEGELVDYIQKNYKNWDGLIINPAGLTHTSVVLRDSILLLDSPIMEVHLSNIYAREEFRHKSLIRDIVTGHICGLGSFGYKTALYYLIQKLN